MSNSYYKALLDFPVLSSMNFNPPTANSVDSVSTLVELMVKQNVGAVIVLEDDLPTGIVTERDVLERVMTSEPLCLVWVH